MIPWNEIWDACLQHEQIGDMKFREQYEKHLDLASDIGQFEDVLEGENIFIVDSNEYHLPLSDESREKIRQILIEERDRLIQEYNSLWE